MKIQLTLISLIAALAILMLAPGCIEKIDADLPVNAVSGTETVDWYLAGTFGGEAVVSEPKADPWEVRCDPGGFVKIAGVCATDDEVWVCDEGISRIQIFDLYGRHRSNRGQGVVLDGLLPTYAEMLEEESKYDLTKSRDWWEDLDGMRWLGRSRDLFRAVDVHVTEDGFWVADWTKTAISRTPKRNASVYFISDNGDTSSIDIGDPGWPTYLAMKDGLIAYTDPDMNAFLIAEVSEDPVVTKKISRGAQFLGLMKFTQGYEGTEYQQLHRRLTNASRSPGGFNGVGGVAVAFDKIIACDSGNSRLQVFEGRLNPRPAWGRMVRIISDVSDARQVRFEVPLDIDIAADGTVFVLDGARAEVAVLSPDFRRIGSFGRGDLVLPRALDLSDDGKHCYVTDSRTNKVMHYAARD